MAKPLNVIEAMQILDGQPEEAALANFHYFRSVFTGESDDPQLRRELEAMFRTHSRQNYVDWNAVILPKKRRE